MTYTKTQRRSLVRTFKTALAKLPDVLHDAGTDWPNRSPYICDVIHRNIINREDVDLATSLIAKRIGYVFSVERWLKDQSEEIATAVRDDIINHNGKKVQAYRKAWLQSMITEFSV